MEDNGVEAQAVEEAKAEGELLEVIEDCTTNFDDSKFCGLGWVRGGRKDAKVTLDFTFRTERVKQAGDSILHVCQHAGYRTVEENGLCRSGQRTGWT